MSAAANSEQEPEPMSAAAGSEQGQIMSIDAISEPLSATANPEPSPIMLMLGFTQNQQDKLGNFLKNTSKAREDFSRALPSVKVLREQGLYGRDYKEAKKPLNAARQAFDTAKAEVSKLLNSIFSKEFGKDAPKKARGLLDELVPPLEE